MIATAFVAGFPRARGYPQTCAMGNSGMQCRLSGTTDPFKLRERFVETHKSKFAVALREIEAGRKKSHWSWFIFPTPPYPGASPTNYYYALKSDEEAKAFLDLDLDGVNLRQNYITIMTAIAEQVEGGNTLENLVGWVDHPKVCSSVRYFKKIAEANGDVELEVVLQRVAKAADIA
mmetsp:Transcript_11181/g.21580  ORF Transcript_11181/g.21580 Transcript_11181/m.21580 type:complete len:176 (+) Transcript_11181:101-628(+)|eukprot:CAMPEP_0167772366 /NCGR_PEP_ID=MMETSP0111_2-20121227/806_1 /TAXON_ID=91324 /ORGANISM="Lotharella globosa, Strain CCCM811" /LENGTH=175 /DNA_ID=CAMNT_0007661847 /DNA_START=126 /DNA_END=653 /DNA_ORIENTATION=-